MKVSTVMGEVEVVGAGLRNEQGLGRWDWEEKHSTVSKEMNHKCPTEEAPVTSPALIPGNTD